MKTQTFILFIASVLISCSGKDCDFVKATEPYHDLAEFQSVPVEGIYKVSALSTDNSFNSSELSMSRLHFISDSTTTNGLNGQFLFAGFPGWDNATSQNKLEDFYGTWTIATQPGGIFGSDRLLISPFYVADFEKVSAKSMVGNLEIRLNNGQPIVVVRVLKDLDMTDAKFGYSFVYPTSKSKDYCNYLVFEKESSTVNDSTKNKMVSFLNSVSK